MEKTSRWWDAPSAILLFLATLFSAWRLQATDWIDGLAHIRNLAILGLILGLVLGESRFKKRGVALLSIGYMLVLFIWQWLGFIEFGEDQTYLGDRLLILFGRLAVDTGEFFAGRAVEDQLLVLVLLSLPYWLASLYSGYQLTRHAGYLQSILPGAVLMLFVTIYHFTSNDYTWMFGVYIFFALLLMGRQKYLLDRKKWTSERYQVSSESSLDLNNTATVIAAVLIMLAWGIPYNLTSNTDAKIAWKNLSDTWFSWEEYENLFTSVNKEKRPVPRNFQTELPLGTQTSMSELIVFLVHVPSSADEFPRLYWRGQVYDRYENNRWSTTSGDEMRHGQTDGDLDIPDTDNRKRVSFTYDIYAEGQALLYSAAQPIWLNHGAIILHSKLGEDTEEMDVMAFRALPKLETGDLYRMSALLANPTIPELMEAGQVYPEWVTEKYLQLPEDFSPRIRALAQEITSEYENPYEKTVAITNYLRSEIRYTPGISIASGGQEDIDLLEYFLFDTKQGFCNYYATAEVLMLRAVGIPARLAVGYAQGEPNLQGNIYTVRERDLHAWPEVYFPGYGWIEFEPTGNQQPLERPLEREEAPAVVANPSNPIPQAPLLDDLIPTLEPAEEIAEPEASLSASQIRWISLLAGSILLISVLVFTKNRLAPNTPVAEILKNALVRNGIRPPNWVIYATLPPIERHFHIINLGLRWMKHPQPAHITAAERAQVLKRLLPEAAESIETLLTEHQAQLFSPSGGNETLARRAAWDILPRALQRRLKTIILGYNYAEV